MVSNNDYLSNDSQTCFEQQILSLMDKHELYFPKEVVGPERCPCRIGEDGTCGCLGEDPFCGCHASCRGHSAIKPR